MNCFLKPLPVSAMNRFRNRGYSLLPPNGRREALTSNRSIGCPKPFYLSLLCFSNGGGG
jgi:hypothetical protein